MKVTAAHRNSACDAILEALRDHPILSRSQLEAYLHYSSAGVRYGLRQLRARKLIWKANAHQPGMRTRALYAPTQASVKELARQARVSMSEFVTQNRFPSERLNRIVITIERVYQLRTFFLWMSPESKRAKKDSKKQTRAPATKVSRTNESASGHTLWRVATWDVDVGKQFSAKEQVVWIPFHGAALFERRDRRWAFAVVEFDTGRAPVAGERERLAHFVAAQDGPRFWGKDKEQLFPVLLVIAQNELRLQDYYTILRSAALSRRLPMPRAYLTTVRAILSLRHDPATPIWYSTVSGHRVPLLFDTEGLPIPLPTQVPWRKQPIGKTTAKRKSTIENSDGSDALSEIAQVSLKLTPLAKLLLDEIAAHPLLKLAELALLLKVSLRWVRPALAEMCGLKLIQVHQSRYLIAPKGEQYLAQAAGYGNAVKRYTRARGWGNGFDALVRHWEHTQEENKFFLRLAQLAHKRHHRLTWLSELEGRLYYEAGQRWHSFLPDGRGSYSAGKTRYEFALEIDRSRAPLARFRGKLLEYDACISSNVLRSEGIELLRLLVVTNSWERAEAWRRSAWEVKVHVPVFITTFDRLEASGVDSPIWLRGDVAASERAADTPKVCCFDCFGEKETARVNYCE